MKIPFCTMLERCGSALRSTLLQRLAAVGLYLIIALATTWPVAQAPATTFPMGTTQAVTVPLFNVWTIWWNADRAAHGFDGYWDAPIFHPAKDAFAFSELQLTSLIVAPIIWLNGSRVLAYNVYMWLSLVLNGIFAERLLRVLKVRSWAAIGGGAAMVMLPIVHWQLDVIQLAPIWGILWCWTACWQATHLPESARWPTALARGIEIGATVSLTFHSCGHHGLFLGLLAVATCWLLPRRWLDRRLWISLIAASVVVAVTVGPFAIHMTRVMKAHNFVRTDALIGSLSGMPQDYLVAPGAQLIDWGSKWARPYWFLSPGWVKLALAGVAIGLGLSRRRTRRITLFLALTVGLSFAMSLGTNLRLGSWQPWPIMAKYVPGLGQVRNVFRFAFFTQIAVVIMSAQAVWWIWLRLRLKLLHQQRWRRVAHVFCLTLAVACAFEVRPYRIMVGGAPNEDANSAWIDFVKEQTPSGSAVLCLPFPKAYECRDFESTTRWMYYGTFHGQPLVNGYSGFFPFEYFGTQDAINAPASYGGILAKLESQRVHFVVIAQDDPRVEPVRTASFGPVQLELVFADPVGVSVYKLRRLPPPTIVLP